MQLLLFFRPICEFNFTFISNFIGENVAVYLFYFYFLKLCFTRCLIIQKLYFLLFSLSYWESDQHTKVSLTYIVYSK